MPHPGHSSPGTADKTVTKRAFPAVIVPVKNKISQLIGNNTAHGRRWSCPHRNYSCSSSFRTFLIGPKEPESGHKTLAPF